MTREEKELLLKDLCARLPYEVKCIALLKQIDGSQKTISGKFKGYNGWAMVETNMVDINTVVPYLRPMSSMTVEEEKIYNSFNRPTGHRKVWVNRIDYLISHYFDYRGLIERGLALEAPEGMYNFN